MRAMWMHADAAEAGPAIGPHQHTALTMMLPALNKGLQLLVHLITHQLEASSSSTDATIQQLLSKSMIWKQPFLTDSRGNLVPQLVQPWPHPSVQAWAEKQAIASGANSLLHVVLSSQGDEGMKQTLSVQLYWLMTSQLAGKHPYIYCYIRLEQHLSSLPALRGILIYAMVTCQDRLSCW